MALLLTSKYLIATDGIRNYVKFSIKIWHVTSSICRRLILHGLMFATGKYRQKVQRLSKVKQAEDSTVIKKLKKSNNSLTPINNDGNI